MSYEETPNYDRLYQFIQAKIEDEDLKHEMHKALGGLVDKSSLGDLIGGIEYQYREHVRNHADWIEDEAPFETEDDLYEYIWQAIDGDSWVIYYHKARCILLVTDNLEAIDEFGLDKVDEAQMAFLAMRQDLYDELHRRHKDINEALVGVPDVFSDIDVEDFFDEKKRT